MATDDSRQGLASQATAHELLPSIPSWTPADGNDYELAKLGGEIFDLRIQPTLKPEDHGKFVAVDVETGDFEIDVDDYTAVARLRARNPSADMWLMCAGYPTAYTIGAAR